MNQSDTLPAASELVDWLLEAATIGASDLHVVPGFAPTVRVHGQLQPLSTTTLTGQTTERLLLSLCAPELLERFQRDKNLDFAPVVNTRTRAVDSFIQRGNRSDENSESTESQNSAAQNDALQNNASQTNVADLGDHLQRFRANLFYAGNQVGGCFRVIPQTVPDIYWAGFPIDLADQLTTFRNGLVLFTGITGSGKSTSLAMMIKKLVEEGGRRIITIEEPIEYVFRQRDGSMVTQREVGQDVFSFADGLKYGLRQDPDVILVGEIRDRETAQIALSAAETGHLIFATLHTRDAKGAISRFADLFPQESQAEVRAQLALSLRSVVSQHLLPSNLPDQKRELALEVLFNTSAMAAAIRLGKIESIDNCIQTSKADGMYLLDESIRTLLRDNRISRETAEQFISDKRALM